jgi:hypothetical protein
MKNLIKRAHFALSILLVAVFTSCATDIHELDGTLIKVKGKYYKMENRMGNAYVLELVKIDSTVVILNSK